MNDNPQVDSRTVKMEELPQCPMGCEKKYLNLIRKKSLDDGNFSATAVDFVECAKCDFAAPIRRWKKLPGIYGGSTVAVDARGANLMPDIYNIHNDSSMELRNLRTRFWALVDIMVVKGTLTPDQKAYLLETKD